MKATSVRTVSLVISVPHVLTASEGMPRQELVWRMLRTPNKSVRKSMSVRKALAAVIQIHSVSTQTWVKKPVVVLLGVSDSWRSIWRGYTTFRFLFSMGPYHYPYTLTLSLEFKLNFIPTYPQPMGAVTADRHDRLVWRPWNSHLSVTYSSGNISYRCHVTFAAMHIHYLVNP